MVVALVLARLLAPHDWGLAAMVLVFSGFVVVFTDNALGTALIQRRQLIRGDRSTVFWVSAGVGLVLTLAGIAFAGPLASFYGEPDVALALRRALARVPDQRSRHDPDGTARTRDGVPEARAAPDRGHARRRGVGITIAIVDRSAWAIVGQLLAGGSHLDGAAVGADRRGGRPSRSRRPACDGSAASPATSSARTCSGRQARRSSAS